VNIYLIGYRCTGKTSVGRCLAECLGLRFVDTDARVIEAAGCSVSDLVAGQGWEAFRGKEAAVLEAVAAADGQVVSTGGGMVLRPENRRRMQGSGLTVWLTARVDTILERMRADAINSGQRPALSESGPEEEIRCTLAERLPLYAGLADLALATDALSVEALCGEIAHWVRGRQPNRFCKDNDRF
jgi:shikimate kinase